MAFSASFFIFSFQTITQETFMQDLRGIQVGKYNMKRLSFCGNR